MTEDEKKKIAILYAAGRIRVTVTSCAGCPYFSKTLISLLVHPNGGSCRCPRYTAAGEITLASAFPVEDSTVIPTECPLRLGDVVVSLGNRGTA